MRLLGLSTHQIKAFNKIKNYLLFTQELIGLANLVEELSNLLAPAQKLFGKV
jgi:hypothetical protein